MNNFSKTKTFFLAFLAAFLVLSFWQVRGGDFYAGRTKMLVLGRGEGEKRNIEQVVENIENFPFDRENTKITRLEKSGILEIEVANQDRNLALSTLEKEIHFIFSAISRYYDIKDEISISLIGKKEVRNVFWEKITKDWGRRAIFSLIVGILAVAMIGKFNKIRLEKERYFSKRQAEIRKSIPTAWEIKENIEQEKAKKTLKKSEELPAKINKSAVAPPNLPIAGDEIERLFGATKNGSGYKISEKEAFKKEMAPEEQPPLYREATPEEVRERLNKLLGNA